MTRKKAVALSYDAKVDSAPKILAKGSGQVAEKIMAIAKEQNIPVYNSPVLVEKLSLIDPGQVIPEDLYQIIAEILVFVDGLTTA
ncbi:MAG: EscU/YscU/HrcU family type III secretion system export apparatus switch protein [Clostridia bacterium]|nr:EscU/YscU/HrcU family type III secretion system export apparatus switch protein [Clostridia bacterium]